MRRSLGRYSSLADWSHGFLYFNSSGYVWQCLKFWKSKFNSAQISRIICFSGYCWVSEVLPEAMFAPISFGIICLFSTKCCYTDSSWHSDKNSIFSSSYIGWSQGRRGTPSSDTTFCRRLSFCTVIIISFCVSFDFQFVPLMRFGL
jgi:hypothetical protein